MTPALNKVEQKTIKLLYTEVMKQVRGWSSGHADLIEQLVNRKDALRVQSCKQVKQVAHIVKDKLAKAVAKLQMRLKECENTISIKMKTIELALKAQDKLESNFDKSMALYHKGNNDKIQAEEKLADLRKRVVSWMPNFVKYENSDIFSDQIKLLKADEKPMTNEEHNKLWDVMAGRMQYDSTQDMWGFGKSESPETVEYMGETLDSKYKGEQLWLRSDLSRLLSLFDVGVPQSVALE